MFTLTEGQKVEMIAFMLINIGSSKETIRALQRKLYLKAKRQTVLLFYCL